MLRKTLVAVAVTAVLLGSSTAWAKKGGGQLPESFRGFSGTLEGVVVARDRNGFAMRVTKVVGTWKDNEARNPDVIVGDRVYITPRMTKDEAGNWHPSEVHLKFIYSLRARERVRLEVKNDEGHRVFIIELDGDQRERAGVRGEGEHRRDGEKEKDRGSAKRREREEEEREKAKRREREREEGKRDGEREREDGKRDDGRRDRDRD